jgi:hypothetical protein
MNGVVKFKVAGHRNFGIKTFTSRPENAATTDSWHKIKAYQLGMPINTTAI